MHYSFINAFRRVRRRVRFVRPHSPLLVRGQATVLTLLALDIRYSVFQWFERVNMAIFNRTFGFIYV